MKEERKERGKKGRAERKPISLKRKCPPNREEGRGFSFCLEIETWLKRDKRSGAPPLHRLHRHRGKRKRGGNIAKEREGQLIGKISAVIFLALPLSVLFFPTPCRGI